jgi:hypothetical protein
MIPRTEVMADPSVPTRRLEELSDRVLDLQGTLLELEEERDRLRRRRRRELLVVGVGLSVLVHLSLMFYLATHYRLSPGSPNPRPVTYEFAIVQEEELTALESTDLDDLLPEVVSDFDDLEADEAEAELEPAVAAAELEVARSGAVPTLGGSGGGSGGLGSLSGGAAGTTFFGVSSRGTRFAYIVDRSGSMGEDRKMGVAKRELARSISSLPDYASFSVIFFSSGFIEPPMQSGWMRARRATVNRFIRWLNEVEPSGGTVPLPAFQEVFSFDVRPDVIFFLTDGEIPNPDNVGDVVADMNGRGGRVVINTIAFGDDRSQELLKRIANESGGVYRFVPSEGG